jgi:hypothetical protein
MKQYFKSSKGKTTSLMKILFSIEIAISDLISLPLGTTLYAAASKRN